MPVCMDNKSLGALSVCTFIQCIFMLSVSYYYVLLCNNTFLNILRGDYCFVGLFILMSLLRCLHDVRTFVMIKSPISIFIYLFDQMSVCAYVIKLKAWSHRHACANEQSVKLP
jgi:hypothetical protein